MSRPHVAMSNLRNGHVAPDVFRSEGPSKLRYRPPPLLTRSMAAYCSVGSHTVGGELLFSHCELLI